jgi:hypothetical protein
MRFYAVPFSFREMVCVVQLGMLLFGDAPICASVRSISSAVDFRLFARVGGMCAYWGLLEQEG